MIAHAPEQRLRPGVDPRPLFEAEGLGAAIATDPTPYCQDESGLKMEGAPAIVLRPGSVGEMTTIVRICHEHGLALTVQGGRTGLAGGAVPDAGDVVVSTERLNRIEEIDPIAGTATVQAGVTIDALARAAEAQDWYFPTDSGARASCQIGGAISTNMGGNRVLRYGTMRALVLGLEVILPNGTLLHLFDYGLKNNTGLNLKQLFIGTEGTLGIVARAVLRLFPRPLQRHCALVAIPAQDRLAPLLKEARRALPTLSSFEVMWRDYLRAAAAATALQEPLAGAFPVTVLLETEAFTSADPERAALDAFLETELENGTILDAVVPQTSAHAAELWLLRDAIGTILPAMAPYVAFDIGIPLRQLARFTDDVLPMLKKRWPAATQLLFGHLGDGNLHLSIGPLPPGDLTALEDAVYAEVQTLGGNISAEHGIGRIKRPFLHYSHTPDAIAIMAGVKSLLDPNALVNRGRILDV